MSSTFWRGVGVAIESARGSAKSISGISKANPAIISSTGHGYSNGDYIYLSVQGMWQMDGRVVRVISSSSDYFSAEAIDSTNYDTFTSGYAYKLTFGTTLSVATNITGSGGEPEYADESTIHDTVRKRAPVLATPLTFNLEAVWDPSDAGLKALKAASDDLGSKAVRFTFSNSYKLVFEGYVNCTMVPTGSFGELVKTPITIDVKGKVQAYTS